jgi:uncharacterized coiled-coil protein SlyX
VGSEESDPEGKINMDIERTIEFLVRNQARMDARFDAKFDRADQRFDQVEKRFAQAEKRLDRLERAVAETNRVVAQNNRVVTKLAQSGVALRGDVRRAEKNLAEVSEKLNILIDVVERHVRGNDHHH